MQIFVSISLKSTVKETVGYVLFITVMVLYESKATTVMLIHQQLAALVFSLELVVYSKL